MVPFVWYSRQVKTNTKDDLHLVCVPKSPSKHGMMCFLFVCFCGGVRGSKRKNYVYLEIHGSQLKAVCHAGNLVLAPYKAWKYSKSNTWIRACTEL